ncbi:MAG: transporter substrate-binding domain-containing protein [Oscillospiraceae bacterium]|jgi:ABC-type amino acid transport substrate-binding protein|nr:transporter substrate-binding domain-containing protein [Oscillospiraceae bacterium]
MKAKRILSILCAAAMLFAFASCGESTATDTPDAAPISSPADFEGRKISVQTATTASDSLDEMIAAGATIDVYPYEKVTQCFDDLKLGRVDAVYVDSVVSAYYIKDSADFVRTWLSDVPEPMGICLAKGSEDLAAAIEAALDALNFSGQMNQIAVDNFGDDFTADLRTPTEAPAIPTEFKTMKDGVLTVGMEVGYPPMEYTTDDGAEYIGFDVDVAKALAELLGLEVEFVNTSWDGIFAGLEKGQYDCIISAVSITPERQEKYILTEPYVANQLCIVTAA